MHRMPGALERELADLAALTDHASTGAHDAYARLRGPLWATLHTLGFDGGEVLVLGDGAPTLLGMPGGQERSVDFVAARLVPLGGSASAAVTPGASSDVGCFDVVVASLPWADVQLRDPARWAQRVVRQAQMTIGAATLARPGGLIAVLATHDLMDAPDPGERRAIMQHAAFLGAVRLPAGVLRPAAGTDNVVDLMVFTAAGPPHATGTRAFETTVQISLPGGDVVLNRYFDDHPEQVLGSVEVEASVWGRPSLTVVGDGATFDREVSLALGSLAAGAVRDGLTAAAPGDPGVAGSAGGWVIEGARRYLPSQLQGGQIHGAWRTSHGWPTTRPPEPDVDL
ncbi:hypothetical protein [Cellulomonas aerilata]|uniref:Uncharacterized protein n=1 Tax=Cellulomonas aerilata TaxID=515326 RepID=A0A512DDQ9_9CELL|nr:hypothetical protein [Cellulomonas aerilata]GEO34360.1 hypothetical protein CAE01nite_20850 [Cellulomonas aerilata]